MPFLGSKTPFFLERKMFNISRFLDVLQRYAKGVEGSLKAKGI